MSDSDQLGRMDLRIRSLEIWRHDRDVQEGREQERKEASDKANFKDFSNLYSRLDKIDSSIGRMVWLIITGIMSAVISFIIGGGLVA